MKELFIAKNVKWLFIKCIIAEILFNLLFFLVFNFNHTYDYITLDIIFGIMQICVAIGLAIYMRRKNQCLFLNKNTATKLYIILIGFLDIFGLVCFFAPDFIIVPYVTISMFVYNIIKMDRLFSFWDFYSCLLCLNIVFLFRYKKECKYQKVKEL